MSTNISQFSSEGLDLGTDSKSLTYLYGLSDFWRYMFEDSDKISLLLEATSTQASEIYNHFLQLTSTLSLEGISTLTNSQIKLVLLPNSSLVAGTPSTYNLPTDFTIASARFIADKPFLPTKTLEENTHYHIDIIANTVTFYKPLPALGFPTKVLQDGSNQYAMWFVDARLDEQLVSKYYGNLLKITPEQSTENFTNFIYGLYYLYINGPIIGLIKRGLNLVLGIPLSRGVETVLDIRLYPNSQEYLVTTDSNSYIIPYGLTPSVAIGDVLQPFQELTTWAVVKDYISDGAWWINLSIPADLIPNTPDGLDNRATVGSHADYIMSHYLYKNTFLVNIKTTNFKDLQTFTKLIDVIHRVKPSYTSPVYVWSVPVPDETIIIDDSTLSIAARSSLVDDLSSNIALFRRDSLQPLLRKSSGFTRFSGPSWLDRQMGLSSIDNGTGILFDGSSIAGFIASIKQYRTETAIERGWFKSLMMYRNDNYMSPSSYLSFCRGINPTATPEGVSVYTNPSFEGYRMVYLYTTTQHDLANRGIGLAASSIIPNYPGWFSIMGQGKNAMGINTNVLDGSRGTTLYDFLITNFNNIFVRGNKVGLPSIYPVDSYKWLPVQPSDIKASDFLAFYAREDGVGVGVYWVTSNFPFIGRPYTSNASSDDMYITLNGQTTRGMGVIGSPYFLTRGSGSSVPGTTGAVNTYVIDGAGPTNGTVYSAYGDSLNPVQNMNRNGNQLIVKGYF